MELQIYNQFLTARDKALASARQLKEAILDGEVNAIQADMALKFLEEAATSIRKDDRIKNILLNEADKYPDKKFEAFGFSVEKTGKTIYDYTQDSVWLNLKKQLTEREKLLKAVKPGVQVFDGDTGEQLVCPVKGSPQWLKYTKIKE